MAFSIPIIVGRVNAPRSPASPLDLLGPGLERRVSGSTAAGEPRVGQRVFMPAIDAVSSAGGQLLRKTPTSGPECLEQAAAAQREHRVAAQTAVPPPRNNRRYGRRVWPGVSITMAASLPTRLSPRARPRRSRRDRDTLGLGAATRRRTISGFASAGTAAIWSPWCASRECRSGATRVSERLEVGASSARRSRRSPPVAGRAESTPKLSDQRKLWISASHECLAGFAGRERSVRGGLMCQLTRAA